MLKTLNLDQWRTHKTSELEFGSGTNVIVGVMGSGKSSIVNAISYALFGTFPALKSKQVTLAEIVMNKPNTCENSTIKLCFEHGGKDYRVERIITPGKTNEAKLYENEKLIAGPKQKDVNEKVEHILGLSYELFSRAIYAEQNEMDFFLKLTPSERKKKFDELLELEKYENARKNALSLKNSLVKENKQRMDYIEQQKETIKNHEEDKVLAQIKNEKKELNELDKALTRFNKQIGEKEKAFEEMKSKEKQFKELTDSILRNKTRLETINAELEKKDNVDLESIKKDKEALNEKLKKKKSEKEEVEKQCKEIELAEKKASEKLRVLEYRKNEIKKENKEIESLKGNCPTCKRELDEKHKKELLEKSVKELREIEKDICEIDQTRKELIETKETMFKQKEIDKVIDEITKNIYELNAKEKSAFEIEEKKKLVGKIEKELPKKESELKKLDFIEETMDSTRKEFFEFKSQKELIESKIKSKKELITSFESNMEKIRLIKKNIASLENECEKRKQSSEKLGVFENCLISTQTELREALLETINIAMSDIWNNIYPYKDFLDARLSIEESGYDLQVQTRQGNWVRVEGILSGGERSAAALCIRIAFALVLTKQLSMLILDEPTHNLDSNAVEKLSTMLRDSLPALVEQVFVITHDKQLESAASSSLYFLNRNKDLDETTQIETISIT
ncbi:MAG: AAA family ATPase [Candidatus Diapherotrites archaeon]|jgi:DNA repair protein SbcC/Rad50|nr:AAA family ATPase [Candidatus Diapherotrites archaeon]MBT4597186.1 AAA family ATPase [Candidatus Diapherotrites archaeon]